jgi:hypothetical protein
MCSAELRIARDLLWRHTMRHGKPADAGPCTRGVVRRGFAVVQLYMSEGRPAHHKLIYVGGPADGPQVKIAPWLTAFSVA